MEKSKRGFGMRGNGTVGEEGDWRVFGVENSQLLIREEMHKRLLCISDARTNAGEELRLRIKVTCKRLWTRTSSCALLHSPRISLYNF
jgi:hypothetical protein